jgi:hypothetical protein
LVCGKEGGNRTPMTRTSADHRVQNQKGQRQSAPSALSAFY